MAKRKPKRKPKGKPRGRSWQRVVAGLGLTQLSGVHKGKDHALQVSIRAHLENAGAARWTVAEMAALAKELGCTFETLAAVCGVKRGIKFKDWAIDGVPGPVSLTLAVIRQFVQFQKTGTLTQPIIPLDAIYLRKQQHD